MSDTPDPSEFGRLRAEFRAECIRKLAAKGYSEEDAIATVQALLDAFDEAYKADMRARNT